MPSYRLLAVALIFVALAGLGWWRQTTTTGSATNRALAGVAFRPTQSTSTSALLPSVVTAATKLGQGRRAVASMPRTSDYSLPALRDTDAGLALQIPNTELPGKTAYEFSALTQSTADARLANNSVTLRFDIYSWSEGILVATANTPITVGGATNFGDVPDVLETLATQFANHRRLLLVLPPGTDGLPNQLNPHDAYVLVAEREG